MNIGYPPTPKGVWPICPIHKIRLYYGNITGGPKLQCWRCKFCLAIDQSTPQPYRLSKGGKKAFPVSIQEFQKGG